MSLYKWLLLEKKLLQAKDKDSFQFLLMSILQKSLHCFQIISYKKVGHKYIVTKASHVSEVDRQSPLIEWIESDHIPAFDQKKVSSKTLDKTEVSAELQSFQQAVNIPIYTHQFFSFGLMCFLDKELEESQIQYLQALSENVGMFYEKFVSKRKPSYWLSYHSHKKLIILFVLAIIALGFLKIPQTVLASAEVMPIKPELVSSSIDGVIKKIYVAPNEIVKKGQKLFSLDDIIIRNKLEESEQKLNVSKKRYLKAYRNAFHDQKAKSEIQLLKSEVVQAEIERAHYRSLLERTVISATINGVVLYSSPNDFIGKPIKVGQRIMLIANPNKKKIDFWIDIDNIVIIDKQRSLVLYPNLHPLKALLLYSPSCFH